MTRSLRPLLATLPLLLALAIPSAAETYRTLRWAVIGDTTSVGWITRAGARLPADSLVNFTYRGGTALKSGDSSFWYSPRLTQVLAFQPDIVSIQLGSADSKSLNWADSANFDKDYKALIDTLRSMPSNPRIVIVYPTPVFRDESTPTPNGRRGSVIQNSIIPRLRTIAIEKSADTVNLHAPLLNRGPSSSPNPNLFPDSVVANTAGNDTLGRILFRAFVDQSIRVMCVGNSITYAVNTNGTIPVKEAYSMRLNMMLGKKYWVWNGGKSGWWMQRAQLPGASSSYKSYVTDKNQMDTLFMMKPHFITVKLGTNDARQNFWNGARFITDYRYFIDTLYNNMTPKPKLILLKAIPAWRVSGNWAFSNSGYTAEQNGINGDIIRDSLKPAIDTIAASRPTQVVQVVDLYTPFLALQSLVTDGVHPTRVGQDSLARFLYRAIQPTVTSIRKNAPGRALRAPALGRRVYLGGGRMPEWMRDMRVMSVNGKAARVGSDGKLPAGVYLVRPKAAAAGK